MKKSERPTGTLAMTFHKPAVEEKLYVRFGYRPQNVFYHTRGKVSGSMNADPLNEINTSKEQQKTIL